MKLKVSKKHKSILDLKDGTLFMYNDVIALKTSQQTAEHCKCFCLDTGAIFQPKEVDALSLNQLKVYTIKIK